MKTLTKSILIFSLVFFYSNLSFSQDSSRLQNKFVMVLDVQNEYTENTMTDSSSQKLIDSINYVIENTDVNKVIYIVSISKMLNLSLTRPFIYVSVDTSAKWGLDNRLDLVNDNIFSKDDANAFTVDELNFFLNQNNAREVIVIGLMAEKCVYETLIGGTELGYEMYVIPEAIVGESQESKTKVLQELEKKGISIFHL